MSKLYVCPPSIYHLVTSSVLTLLIPTPTDPFTSLLCTFFMCMTCSVPVAVVSERCDHSVVFMDLCSDCGMDMRGYAHAQLDSNLDLNTSMYEVHDCVCSQQVISLALGTAV